MANWTSDNITNAKKIIDAFERGFMVNGKQVTDLYNSIFNKSLTSTNCSTCIRTRAKMIKQEYEKLERELKQEEDKAPEQNEQEEIITPTIQVAKKRGRPKKS